MLSLNFVAGIHIHCETRAATDTNVVTELGLYYL